MLYLAHFELCQRCSSAIAFSSGGPMSAPSAWGVMGVSLAVVSAI